MGRKQYRILAAALARTRPDRRDQLGGVLHQQWAADRDAIADALEADNPRFRRDLFVRAATEAAA